MTDPQTPATEAGRDTVPGRGGIHYRMTMSGTEPFCPTDKQDWPCDAIKLLRLVEASIQDLGIGTDERVQRAAQRLMSAYLIVRSEP